MKVFIADDSRPVVERLRALLNEITGLELTGSAGDLPNASQSICELNPDVVILDLQMPGGSGIDLLQRIKKERPHIKVIVFTNFPHPQYRKKCLDLGADFFLDKAQDIDRIPGILQELVENAAKTA